MTSAKMIKIRKFMKVYIAVALCMMGIAAFTITANAEQTIPSFIIADYTGDSLLVGDEIDLDNLTVTAVYSNGSTDTVKDYAVSTTKALTEGINTITVVYLGKTTTFVVYARAVKEVFAAYSGTSVSVGNAVDPRNVYVYAVLSDETTIQVKDFKLYKSDIEAIGDQRVVAVFAGKMAEFTVTGVIPEEVNTITVSYIGGDVMVGRPIDSDDIYVTAFYKNGKSETIISYEMAPASPTLLGINTVTVSFRGKTASFTVNGIAKEISSIKAVYSGGEIEVGKEVETRNITVTATYTDGSTGIETDFSLPSPRVYTLGSQIKTVHCAGYTDDIIVIGVEKKETSYENASVHRITNGTDTGTLMAAIPEGLTPDMFSCSSLANSTVKKVISRAVRNSKYIAIDIEINDELDEETPVEIMISVPSDFDVNKTSMYYTPNNKTVIGRLNTEVTDDGFLLAYVYHTGIYVLSYSAED